MNRRSFVKSKFGIGAGFMLALAGLMGSAQASQSYVNAPTSQGQAGKDLKATPAAHATRQARTVHTAGGLDLLQRGEYGMSPMEYGMRYGHGNKGRHTNKLACSHRAKVSRRG
jgi:hypothetical protein